MTSYKLQPAPAKLLRQTETPAGVNGIVTCTSLSSKPAMLCVMCLCVYERVCVWECVYIIKLKLNYQIWYIFLDCFIWMIKIRLVEQLVQDL